jgi:flagellar biosynthesis protein FlhF
MGAKTYRAGTMREALARVRQDLGSDAVILASRELHKRRLFGLGTRDLIEVTASSSLSAEGQPLGHDRRITREPWVWDTSSSATTTSALSRFGEQLGQLHAVVDSLSRQGRLDQWLPDLPTELVSTYAKLIEAEVPEVAARRLLRHVADFLEADQFGSPLAIQASICQALAESIPIAPPIQSVAGTRRVVALVGPTGVGKTTTVAKLAANIKLVHGLRVGLVTVDTYRIAAIEQLKTYAEIIDVPLVVANDPGEMRNAIEELGPMDMVFIDTAGRSPRDEVKIRELAEFMSRARPDEVHLVLSAGAGERSLRAAAERFAQVSADRLILTKLDEAESLGAILGVVGPTGRPISYLTTGQAVPDDIEPADRQRLVRLILGLEVIGS